MRATIKKAPATESAKIKAAQPTQLNCSLRSMRSRGMRTQ